VTNLTGEKYSTYENNYIATLTQGYAQRYPAPPRRFEITAEYHF
jgi:outer membrane receptor protein involved in Fe transport